MSTEIIVGVRHPFIPDCMVNFEPGCPAQCVTLILMDDKTGKLRTVTTTLDHKAKNYIVTDGPAPEAVS